MPFVYSEDALHRLDQTISTERLIPYLSMVQGDRNKAIHLYERNTVTSERFYGPLQALEISLRNSIHRTVATGKGRDDWYNETALLDDPEIEMIVNAKSNIQRALKTETPGRVIAELTFGFWLQLMTARYEKTLWVPHIHKCFPKVARPDRNLIYTRFNKIRILRNRVAHHERIIHRNLGIDYQRILEALQWMCPVTAAWVNTRQRIFSH